MKTVLASKVPGEERVPRKYYSVWRARCVGVFWQPAAFEWLSRSVPQEKFRYTVCESEKDAVTDFTARVNEKAGVHILNAKGEIKIIIGPGDLYYMKIVRQYTPEELVAMYLSHPREWPGEADTGSWAVMCLADTSGEDEDAASAGDEDEDEDEDEASAEDKDEDEDEDEANDNWVVL